MSAKLLFRAPVFLFNLLIVIFCYYGGISKERCEQITDKITDNKKQLDFFSALGWLAIIIAIAL